MSSRVNIIPKNLNISLDMVFVAAAAVGVGLSYGPVYASHLVLLAWAVLIVRKTLAGGHRFFIPQTPTNLHMFMVVMLLWYAISMIWSAASFQTAKYLFIIAYGSAIVFAVVYTTNDEAQMRKLFSLLSWVVAVEVIVALLEAFTAFRWPISPLSALAPAFGREMTVDALKHTEATLAIINNYPTGFSWNPNNLVMVMNLILPFMLFHRKRLVRILGPVTVFLIIFKASSKTGFLTFILIMAIYLIFFSSRRWFYILLTGCALLTIIFAGNVFKDMAGHVQNRQVREIFDSVDSVRQLFSRQSLINDSIGLRRKYMANSLSAFKKSGGWGVGGGCIGEERYHPDALESGDHRVSIHNFWLELLVEGGLIFGGFFALWYGIILGQLAKVRARAFSNEMRRLASACFLSLIGLIPAAVSPSSAIYIGPMWILFGLSIATINIFYRQQARVAIGRQQ